MGEHDPLLSGSDAALDLLNGDKNRAFAESSYLDLEQDRPVDPCPETRSRNHADVTSGS
jgi:hypothetical protein